MKQAFHARAGYQGRRSFGRRTAAAAAFALAAATPLALHACKATSGGGVLTIEFTPELTIVAHGLEDAKDQLAAMILDCIDGGLDCPPKALQEMFDAYNHVVDRKGELVEDHRPPPGSEPV